MYIVHMDNIFCTKKVTKITQFYTKVFAEKDTRNKKQARLSLLINKTESQSLLFFVRVTVTFIQIDY